MATNPAEIVDIEVRWRPLSDAETIVADTLLSDAWVLLKHADSTIDTRLDAAELDSELVKIVLVEMVKRVLRNPDGIRQESIQDYSVTRDATSGNGLLHVTDDELVMLASSETAESDAFTIRPAYQIPVDSSTYVAADWEWA